MLDVVEDQQRVGEQEQAVVQPQVVRRQGRQRLEEAHGVVADHADRAADERRQFGGGDVGVPGQQLLQNVQRVALAGLQGQRLDLRAFRDRGRVALGAEDQERVAAQERVAGQALAALDAFQQERVGPPARDLAEGGHGRLHVRQHFAPDGDEVAQAGLFNELVTGRCGHRWHQYTSARVGAGKESKRRGAGRPVVQETPRPLLKSWFAAASRQKAISVPRRNGSATTRKSGCHRRSA